VDKRPGRKGFSDANIHSTLLGAKNFGFFEIYGVYTRTRGRRGRFFANIFADVFYGNPLFL